MKCFDRSRDSRHDLCGISACGGAVVGSIIIPYHYLKSLLCGRLASQRVNVDKLLTSRSWHRSQKPIWVKIRPMQKCLWWVNRSNISNFWLRNVFLAQFEHFRCQSDWRICHKIFAGWNSTPNSTQSNAILVKQMFTRPTSMIHRNFYPYKYRSLS